MEDLEDFRDFWHLTSSCTWDQSTPCVLCSGPRAALEQPCSERSLQLVLPVLGVEETNQTAVHVQGQASSAVGVSVLFGYCGLADCVPFLKFFPILDVKQARAS